MGHVFDTLEGILSQGDVPRIAAALEDKRKGLGEYIATLLPAFFDSFPTLHPPQALEVLHLFIDRISALLRDITYLNSNLKER